jgi:23S rRNA maturation mini-RNase III
MDTPRSDAFQRLRIYIAERMRMSHIYQPLMLLELLGRHSPAPAQDVARRILGEDVTQIDYYTERVKRMVGKVLTGNGITTYTNGSYSLIGADELSDEERDLVRRGRNRAGRGPRRGEAGLYGLATGFETMVGWLFLQDPQRLAWLLDQLIETEIGPIDP